MFPWPDHPAFTTLLSTIKGVGPKTLIELQRLQLNYTGDILALAPSYYQDRRKVTNIIDLVDQQEALIEGEIIKVRQSRKVKRFLECSVKDETGLLYFYWFNQASYLIPQLKSGYKFRAFGKVKIVGSKRSIIHPDLEFIKENELDEKIDLALTKIKPIYRTPGKITPATFKKVLDYSLELLKLAPTIFPKSWLDKHQLVDPVRALQIIHNPPQNALGTLPNPKQSKAFKQLAFFELLLWRLLILKEKSKQSINISKKNMEGSKVLKSFIKMLPFKLSPEQDRVLKELIKTPSPMSRLIQGEVGSGKTVIGVAMLFLAAGRKEQSVFIAPTELLANQHFSFIKPYADSLGYKCSLLTGSLKESEKISIRKDLVEGKIDLLIGTQAILSESTKFKNLGLAVIDEQHRFGVKQRLSIRDKGKQIDLLALSATPIPRSLALTIYGDLEISSMQGGIPGRKQTITKVYPFEDKTKIFKDFFALISDQGQGFVVCPKIGSQQEEEEENLTTLHNIYAELKTFAPMIKIAIIHGQLKPEERQETLNLFRQGKYQVLLATTIIEVGVDIPSAEAMMIVSAENFGLAQLHQLRGRVGRGNKQGYCLLLAGSKLNKIAIQRLQAIQSSTNGYELAEQDLKLRGPGEELGLKQSGWPEFNFASLPENLPMIAKAHQLADELWAGSIDINLKNSLESFATHLISNAKEAV